MMEKKIYKCLKNMMVRDGIKNQIRERERERGMKLLDPTDLINSKHFCHSIA